MDLASLLDNLTRQVPAREISINAACTKIEGHINSLNREDARSLRHALPSLLKLLLGSPDTAGWIELLNPDSYSSRLDSQALINLLSPKGLLFSALLSQVPDLGFFYEIPASNFPAISRKIIETGQLDLLPVAVYENRLVKSPDGHFLRLNMVEYFLFYFLYALSSTSAIDANVSGLQKHFPQLNSNTLTSSNASSSAASTARRLMSQLGLSNANTSLAFHWRAEASSQVYLSLLKEYLAFMVPELTPQLADTSASPPENILTTLLLKSSSPIWSRIDTGCRYSAFFTGILVEFWLNSYSYAVDSEGNPYSLPEFVLPSVDFLQALQVVARHYSSAFALSLSTTSTSAFVDPAYKILATEAFHQIRLSFYRYLRVAISVWPIDGTLNYLIEIWMSIISPWFHLEPQVANASHLPIDDSSPNFGPAWKPFIVGTFYLYQSLYAQFFRYSSSALEGFLLSGDCADLNEAIERLGALSSCLLEVMNPLMSVSLTFKKIEIDLVKYSSSFIRFASSDVSEINEQLRILEPESFHPHSLFDSKTKLVTAKILLILDNLVVGILHKYRQSSMQSQESLTLTRDQEDEDFENDAEAREALFNFILESSKCSNDVKSLAKWSLQLRQDFLSVFLLNADDFKSAKDSIKSMLDSRSASSPSVRKRGIRVNPPQNLLKYKLSAKPNIDALSDPEGIVRSYEIGPLIPILRALSNILTQSLHSLVLETVETKWNVKFPQRIWNFRFNLRFLAAYPNIFFIILCWMVFKIVIKILF